MKITGVKVQSISHSGPPDVSCLLWQDDGRDSWPGEARRNPGQGTAGLAVGESAFHRICEPHPARGIGKELLGDGPHPFPGSGETLCRGIYDFRTPFKVTHSASLRMVADLSDNDKVLAVLPGGVAGRFLHPHGKDQIKPFLTGDKVYWWFSDRAIQEHKKTTLLLAPK